MTVTTAAGTRVLDNMSVQEVCINEPARMTIGRILIPPQCRFEVESFDEVASNLPPAVAQLREPLPTSLKPLEWTLIPSLEAGFRILICRPESLWLRRQTRRSSR